MRGCVSHYQRKCVCLGSSWLWCKSAMVTLWQDDTSTNCELAAGLWLSSQILWINWAKRKAVKASRWRAFGLWIWNTSELCAASSFNLGLLCLKFRFVLPLFYSRSSKQFTIPPSLRWLAMLLHTHIKIKELLVQLSCQSRVGGDGEHGSINVI